ncbi:D-mannonate dehydratase ManD [Escherichia coli]
MKIVKAEVFVTCPGRNFVTLKITTEDGITGLGDATLNGRELSVASYLQDHLCPQLIGRDAHRIEDIWQFFYKGAYWRRGPVTMSAISAVDMALWDIKAKAANMPLYQLLGGASREGVMVYCHTTGHSIDEALDDYARHQELGFKAIRVQCGIPGMKTTYGMSKGKGLAYEPATKGQWPEEQLWSTEKYLDFMPKLFDAVRNKFGFNEHLLHDMHHRLTPIEAARFGKSIEDYRMFWMEDPTPAENQECFRLIRQHTVTPIAVGEVFNSIWDCKQLIEEQLIDYIRTTLTHAGGITGMRRIADFASLYQVRTGSHGPSDLSPVCMAAALHFDLWVPNFGVQEYMGYSEQMLEVFPHNWTFDKGKYTMTGEAFDPVEVDMGRSEENNITQSGGTEWSKRDKSTYDPTDDIEAYALNASGVVNIIVFDPKGWALFRSFKAVKEKLDTRRGSNSELETAVKDLGKAVSYIGYCCKRRCTRTYCRYWCSYALRCDWFTWTYHHR